MSAPSSKTLNVRMRLKVLHRDVYMDLFESDEELNKKL